MDFFNIGTGELVFLVVIAILVVGPKRAVALVQQAGRFAARMQKEWRSVQRDVMAEVEALKEETLGGAQADLHDELRDLELGVRAGLKSAQKETRAPRDPARKKTPAAAVDSTPRDIPGPTDDKAG
jgi:Sec-independent protein translocase protein TatA